MDKPIDDGTPGPANHPPAGGIAGQPLEQPLLEQRRALAKARIERNQNAPPPLPQAELERLRANAQAGLPLWHRVWENPQNPSAKPLGNPPDFSEITRGIARSS